MKRRHKKLKRSGELALVGRQKWIRRRRGLGEPGITETIITCQTGIRYSGIGYNGNRYNKVSMKQESGITESGRTESGITENRNLL